MAITSGDKNSQLDNILQFARQNEYFRTRDIEELLHIGPSRARQLISELVSEEQLMALGQNRNRRYQLKK